MRSGAWSLRNPGAPERSALPTGMEMLKGLSPEEPSMATTAELLAFGQFAAVTVASSVGVVLVRDTWHAALLLGVALFSVAVHFVMQRAEFLAAMQILVYVGGVLILISFAVMLTRRRREEVAA